VDVAALQIKMENEKGTKKKKRRKREITKLELYAKRKLTRTNVSMKSHNDVK
jgi:hypothetical protein